MIDKINPIEKKLEKKRKKISFIITVFIHFMFCILFLLAGRFNLKKEETIVINVTLADKIYESRNLSKNIKKKPEKKESNITQNIKSDSSKKETKHESILKNEITEMENRKNTEENKTVVEDYKTIEKDIIKEYEKEKADEKKKIEEDFFSNKETIKESKNNPGLDKILDNIDKNNNSEDNLINSKDNSKSDNTILGESNIQWEGGKSRKLIYKTELTIPEEFKKEGLNTNLILRLTVIDSGFITKVTIQRTSGFNLLDYDIANQVKRWKFEEAKGSFPATAILPLNIIY
ncbi:MAG: hypothetical protein JXB50_01145 [Spirochaetes bacterium]|nr:hypothetical protein [Spirochaetota bacterium]